MNENLEKSLEYFKQSMTDKFVKHESNFELVKDMREEFNFMVNMIRSNNLFLVGLTNAPESKKREMEVDFVKAIYKSVINEIQERYGNE